MKFFFNFFLTYFFLIPSVGFDPLSAFIKSFADLFSYSLIFLCSAISFNSFNDKFNCGFTILILSRQIFFLYLWDKEKIFYNNLGIHAAILYFCFVLIDLVNDYKKNHNGFHENCLYNGFLFELLVCDGFFVNCFL